MTIDTDDIRLRPDGSIDTAYYLARGRRERARQAHRMARACLSEKRHRRTLLGTLFTL